MGGGWIVLDLKPLLPAPQGKKEERHRVRSDQIEAAWDRGPGFLS